MDSLRTHSSPLDPQAFGENQSLQLRAYQPAMPDDMEQNMCLPNTPWELRDPEAFGGNHSLQLLAQPAALMPTKRTLQIERLSK